MDNISFKDSKYFHVGHAPDLKGKDYVLYRFLEMIPGLLAWGTLIGVILLSAYIPTWAAYFIIAFDFYWLLKTVHLANHHIYNWRRLRHNIKVDWNKLIGQLKYEHLYHLVILPFYKEGEAVLEASLQALVKTEYKKSRMIIVLAAEERAGQEYVDLAYRLQEKYENEFKHVLVTIHPDGLPGEIRGKGPNITFAAEKARVEVLDPNKINYSDVIVSAFDVDTVVWPQYFLCLTWHFLTTEDPHNASFQPVPLYNNNIWYAPALSRVAAMTSTFWQMIQQERPEKLTTFSSHSLSFKTLYEVGYWQKNMISDDSRIFWNIFLAKNGNYRVVPISYPVSMDANLDASFWQTMVNIYKQHLRWMWGSENIPYMLMGFIKNKKINFWTKVKHTAVQIEGFWSLATNPLLILMLGWLPIILGGDRFRDTVLSYNLPHITQWLMTIAMLGLFLSAYIAITLAPPIPKDLSNHTLRKVLMSIQWLFVPITIIIFGSLPGLHAQTRLMFGKYIGAFWVTPKHRKNK